MEEKKKFVDDPYGLLDRPLTKKDIEIFLIR